MRPRIYIALRRQALSDEFLDAYRKGDPGILDKYVVAGLKGAFDLGFPSLKFPPRPEEKGPHDDPLSGLSRLVLAVAADSADVLAEVAASAIPGAEGAGPDLAFGMSDHWCPGAPPGNVFGTRAAANRLIGRQALKDRGLSGRNVNLVVVDHGLSVEGIAALGGRFGGGWKHLSAAPPGERAGLQSPVLEPGRLQVVRGVTDNDHGMMVARNVIAVAPGTTLHDCPLILPRVGQIATFLSDAEAACNRILAHVRATRAVQGGDWILLNAWAMFDRSTFEVPLGGYTESPEHPFNRLVDEIAGENIELVFAAGNSGQFCPDQRSGSYDIGPGRSIYGANAHPEVLTVGAVRTDGMWLGLSSQGPGPKRLAALKPDLCAPSAFSETQSRHRANGGTSAACALAAGVLAALREHRPTAAVPPARMRQVLRDTARRPPTAVPWDERLGYGIIDAAAALAAL